MITIKTAELLTTQGAALKSGLSPRRIHQLAESGALASIALHGPTTTGPQRAYRTEDIEKLVRERVSAREGEDAGEVSPCEEATKGKGRLSTGL